MPPKPQDNKHKKSNNNDGQRNHQKVEQQALTNSRRLPGSIEDIPILEYVHSKGSSNFYDFKDPFCTYIFRKYGQQGKTFDETSTKLYYPPEIELPVVDLTNKLVQKYDENGNAIMKNNGRPLLVQSTDMDPFSRDNDPHGLILKKYIKEVEQHSSKIREYQNDYISIFYILWGNMSLESKAKAKEIATFVESERDVFSLWTAIKSTHRGLDGSNNTMDQQAAKSHYHKMYQGKNESTSNFRKRFEDSLDQLKASGYAHVPDEAEMALDFLHKLDKGRFANFHKEIKNNKEILKIDPPQTVVDVYRMASRYVDVSYRGESGAPISTTSDQRLVFATNTSQGQGKSKSNGNNHKSSSNNNNQKADSGDGKKRYPCFLCKQHGHASWDCPLVPKVRDFLDQEEVALPVIKAPSKANKKSGNVALTTIVLSSGIIESQPLLEAYDILLDSCATVSIFADENLVTNIRKTKTPIIVNGIGGKGLEIDQIADAGSFGTVYYHPEAIANIISQTSIIDQKRLKVEYNSTNDLFTIHINPNKEYTFTRKGGLYVCNVSYLLLGTNDYNIALVTTVTENESHFTKREVKAARAARDLKRVLGYASDHELLDLIKTGIKDSPVDEVDVHRAHQIYGKDLGEVKGKTVRRKAGVVKVSSVPRPIQMAQSLHVDIIFIEGIPFLISVSKPLGYTMINHLVSRGLSAVSKALYQHINAYKVERFAIEYILSDGEGAIAALSDRLRLDGINFQSRWSR